MRMSVTLDDELVQEALKLTGIKTKRELVEVALKTFVEVKAREERMDREGILELDGKVYHVTPSKHKHA